MPMLPNGTVLPHGMLSHQQDLMAGFNKTYRNSSLRLGIIIEAYPISDDANLSKLTTEYDVLVFEQIENKGSTTIIYKNCMNRDAFGSIADFLDYTLRSKESTSEDSTNLDIKGQNGACVLIECIDGVSEKAIIVGGITHPDRECTLEDEGPRLEGEFNGVNVKIEDDGSVVLTFNGATDNDGEPLDEEQAETKLAIEKDGSVQIDHDSITFRMDRTGVLTVTAKDDVKISCKNAVVVAEADVNVTCVNATVTASDTSTVEGKTVKLGEAAAEAVVKGDTFKKLFDAHLHPTPIGPSGPPSVPLAPSALSTKCKTE